MGSMTEGAVTWCECCGEWLYMVPSHDAGLWSSSNGQEERRREQRVAADSGKCPTHGRVQGKGHRYLATDM